jgi:hypothetical protein
MRICLAKTSPLRRNLSTLTGAPLVIYEGAPLVKRAGQVFRPAPLRPEGALGFPGRAETGLLVWGAGECRAVKAGRRPARRGSLDLVRKVLTRQIGTTTSGYLVAMLPPEGGAGARRASRPGEAEGRWPRLARRRTIASFEMQWRPTYLHRT